MTQYVGFETALGTKERRRWKSQQPRLCLTPDSKGFMNRRAVVQRLKKRMPLRQLNCRQLEEQPMSLIGQVVVARSKSEVMTAMNDKDRFTVTELTALRNDLIQGGMIDSFEAAQLLQVFLMGRGYGVSPKAALDAASRVEMAGCALPVLQFELENLAMVM